MVGASTLLTFANTVLILATLALGIQTAIFQKRTSLRESLEQLGSMLVGSEDIFLVVLLNDFEYVPLRRETAILKFQLRTANVRGTGGVGKIRNMEEHLFSTFDADIEEFGEFETVDEVWSDASGFYLKTNTVDAVKCQNLAEEVYLELEKSSGSHVGLTA